MARASMHVGSACACTCTGTGAWVNCMHGVECMGVHGRVHGRVQSCMHAWECMHACTLVGAHAWCTRGAWVGWKYCRGAGCMGVRCTCMESDRVHTCMGWLYYKEECTHACGWVDRVPSGEGGPSSAKVRINWRSAHQTRISEWEMGGVGGLHIWKGFAAEASASNIGYRRAFLGFSCGGPGLLWSLPRAFLSDFGFLKTKFCKS